MFSHAHCIARPAASPAGTPAPPVRPSAPQRKSGKVFTDRGSRANKTYRFNPLAKPTDRSPRRNRAPQNGPLRGPYHPAVLAAVAAMRSFFDRVPNVPLVPLSPDELRKYARAFVQNGIFSVPIISASHAKMLGDMMVKAVHKAPEFITPPRTHGKDVKPHERHTMGGFGGVNLPSVLHSDVARLLRTLYHRRVMQLVPYILWQLAESDDARHAQYTFNADRTEVLINGKPAHVKQLMDRPLVRDASARVTPEEWHSDCCEKGEVYKRYGIKGLDGIRFGGWIALHMPQSFIHVPGTSSFRVLDGGFNRMSAAEKARLDGLKQVATIQPGEAFFFDETIVHSVANPPKTRKPRKSEGAAALAEWEKKRTEPMVRLFVAFDINSHDAEPLYPLSDMRDGALIPLKSGQHPPMYPVIYWVNHFGKILEYSDRLAPACTVERERPKNSGVMHRVACKVCPSLKAQGKGPVDYTDEELDMFKGVRVPLM